MKLKKLVAAMAVSGMLANVAGCGVLLHPERQGQTGGNIDVKVALLDGIGLLFFVVPGLVAFAVDFHQGTIYLPGGSASVLNDEGLRAVQIDGEVNEAAIEAAILEQTGVGVDLSSDNVQAQKITPAQLGMISTIALLNNDRSTVVL